jgi:hypothetical protein
VLVDRFAALALATSTRTLCTWFSLSSFLMADLMTAMGTLRWVAVDGPIASADFRDIPSELLGHAKGGGSEIDGIEVDGEAWTANRAG